MPIKTTTLTPTANTCVRLIEISVPLHFLEGIHSPCSFQDNAHFSGPLSFAGRFKLLRRLLLIGSSFKYFGQGLKFCHRIWLSSPMLHAIDILCQFLALIRFYHVRTEHLINYVLVQHPLLVVVANVVKEIQILIDIVICKMTAIRIIQSLARFNSHANPAKKTCLVPPGGEFTIQDPRKVYLFDCFGRRDILSEL